MKKPKPKPVHSDKIGRADAKNWIMQAGETVLRRYAEVVEAADREDKKGVQQEGFDVEAYIATLGAAATEPKAAEEGETAAAQCEVTSGSAEQKARLIEVNRQVALHRKALKQAKKESEDRQPDRPAFTEKQAQTITANRAEAIRRATEKKTK